MNIRSCKANLKVKEVPSFEAVRLFGESKLKALTELAVIPQRGFL